MEQAIGYYQTLLKKRRNKFKRVNKQVKRRIQEFYHGQAQLRMVFVLLMCSSVIQMCSPRRSTWVREHSTEWWDNLVNNTFTARDWLTNFCMSKTTFTYLCSYINNSALTPEQQTFNSRLSHTRVIVEHVFGRLKGRWRCLCTKLGIHIPDVPEVIGACSVLHNMCQLHGEVFEEDWLLNSEDPEQRAPNHHHVVHDTGGERVRRAFTSYFDQ